MSVGHGIHRLAFVLWNRTRPGRWRDIADGRRAGRKRRSRDKEVVTLPRRRTIGICGGVARHATAGKGINVGIRCREAVRERLQESDYQVLFVIGQSEHSNRHVDIVRDLRHRPAVYFFGCSRGAVS